jgi:23S rRNA (adenine2503-C2)-methyltransferase
MIYFQSLTQEELAELLVPVSQVRPRTGEAPEAADQRSRKRAKLRAQQIFHWVYQRYVVEWDGMTDLSKDLREWLKQNVAIFRLNERISRQAMDGTHKFLWDLADNKTIESVIIPAALQEKQSMDDTAGAVGDEVSSAPQKASTRTLTPSQFAGRKVEADLESDHWSRLTACISSQVGCAMACKFCLTGVQGLDRHLEVHEIVTQVHELRMRAPITNIVFMGMGEPLHNVDNVIKACKILLDQDGMNFSKRKVTVSTSGLVPAIEKLGANVDVSLAISLNASTDEQRSQIMPVNRKWNIDTLMNTCRNFPLGPHRRITFEYVMLGGFNDTVEDALRVAKLVRGIPSKVNLIPFNEHPGADFRRPTDEAVRKFQRVLLDRNITATVRISRGRDILAACGQLRSIFGTARGTEKHQDWKPLPVLQASAEAEASARS